MDFASRYKILRRLGEGGMAEVLEAEMLGEGGFRRRVALKRILPSRAADGEFVRRFVDEARIASHLHHANIVAVVDFGVADGLPFQVLEFVDGIDLRTAAKRAAAEGSAIPETLALHICKEVAHALRAAHEARDPDGKPLRIVHRDVTPHNVMLSWQGDVKLSDFGIALARVRTEKTQAGFAMGKPGYMAPEQLLGGHVGPTVDLFALGCVLHVLLAGESPFDDEAKTAALLQGRDVPLSEELPGDLRDVMRRALMPRIEDRYGNAAEMATALDEALARRTPRDARTELTAWLAPLRPAAAPNAGGLDALLGGAPPGQGRTVPPPTTPVPASADTIVSSRQQAPVSVMTVPPAPAPSPRRNVALVGVLAIALVLLVGWVARSSLFPPESIAQVSPLPSPTPLATATSAATVTATPAKSPSPVHTRLARHSPVPRASPSASAPLVAGTPAPMAALRLGGRLAVKAEIFVDGKKRGFAPAVIDVPAGEHVVDLVTPDGRHLGPRTIRIEERNTRLSPAAWIAE